MEDRTLLATWTTVAPMLTARAYLAGVLGSDGLVYAIGGSDSAGSGRNSLKTVEAYRTGADFWSTKANMNVARQALGAAEGNDGRIYAFGGATAFSTAAVTNTAECFSPTLNKWTLVANMPTGRVGLAGATGSDGQIYAMGGSPDYGITVVNTVEAYNTSSGTWSGRGPRRMGESLPRPRARLQQNFAIFRFFPPGWPGGWIAVHDSPQRAGEEACCETLGGTSGCRFSAFLSVLCGELWRAR